MRFLFVDRILALEPGRSIDAERTFTGDEDFFRDHFPGFPVVPGVLLVETMAQAAGKCLDAESRERGRGKAMLAQIRSASFREWVRPGEKMSVKAGIRSSQAEFATAQCSIVINGRRICTADLLFSFLPLDRFDPGYRDDILETFLESREGGTERSHG